MIAAAPQPGIHRGMSDKEYHAAPGASKSRLWKMHSSSPAHVAATKDVDTEALCFGRAFDDYLFFPDEFDGRWVNTDTKGWDTASVQGLRAEVASQGMDVLTPSMRKRLEPMADSIRAHPIAGEIFAGKGVPQTSMFWDDPESGVFCKGRVDWFTTWQGCSTHVDLKTARNAGPHGAGAFPRAANDHGYPLQAIHYLCGCEAMDVLAGRTPRQRKFLFVVIESSPDAELEPQHRVEVYEYTTSQLDALRPFRRALLDRWKQCLDRDSWPGREHPVRQLYVPDFLINYYGDMQS